MLARIWICGAQRTAALRSGQFSINRACGSSMPSLDGAFCSMGVAIDYLKVWQAPVTEQFRPSIIAMVTPNSKEWDAVIYLSILPEPSTCLSASPRLKTPEKRCFVTRRIPEFPCDHTGTVPVRVLVGARVPQINMPAKAINGLPAHAAESSSRAIGAVSIRCWRRSERGRQTVLATTAKLPGPALRRSAAGREGAR
jgi:hypothetical protein